MSPYDWPMWLFLPFCWLCILAGAVIMAWLDDNGRSE